MSISKACAGGETRGDRLGAGCAGIRRIMPEAALLEPGGRVMLQADRLPVSRVREIRTHGLKGGPAPSPVKLVFDW